MTTTINAVSGTGLTQTSDGSGIVKLQSNGVATNALAWVNFNGNGTVAIRSSYNVSSITDNGTGQYIVNLTTATTDANYAAIACMDYSNTTGDSYSQHNVWAVAHPITTTTVSVMGIVSTTYLDGATFSVVIFGN